MYYFNLASRKFMQSRAKSCKVRLFPYVMGSHGKSRKVLLFPNFSPKLPAKSCQVIGSHGQSCQVRGIPRTKGGLHSYAQLCKWQTLSISSQYQKINSKITKFQLLYFFKIKIRYHPYHLLYRKLNYLNKRWCIL